MSYGQRQTPLHTKTPGLWCALFRDSTKWFVSVLQIVVYQMFTACQVAEKASWVILQSFTRPQLSPGLARGGGNYMEACNILLQSPDARKYVSCAIASTKIYTTLYLFLLLSLVRVVNWIYCWNGSRWQSVRLTVQQQMKRQRLQAPPPNSKWTQNLDNLSTSVLQTSWEQWLSLYL